MPAAAAKTRSANPIIDVMRRLHSIKIGGVSTRPDKAKIRRRDLTYILSNLATLLENGVSLPRALSTLAREPSLQKYKFILDHLHRSLEAGEQFSSVVANFPATFDELTVNQLRVGGDSDEPSPGAGAHELPYPKMPE